MVLQKVPTLSISTIFLAFSSFATIWTQPVFAQGQQSVQQLIAKLVQLVRQKGYANYPLGRVCKALELTPVGNCETYQSGYVGTQEESVIKDTYGHAFNFYEEPETRKVRIVIFRTNKQEGEFYLVDTEGALERAGKRVGAGAEAIWSSLSYEAAMPGFKYELEYWRAQQSVLAKEPDRCSDRWNAEYPKDKC
jgi:hypothetical protein